MSTAHLNSSSYSVEKKEEQFLKKVLSYPYLYDTSHAEYKNVDQKKMTWQQIGRQFNLDGETAQQCFRKLRNKYVRIKGKLKKHEQNGAKAYQPKWHLYALMDKTIKLRRTMSSNLKNNLLLQNNKINTQKSLETSSSTSMNLAASFETPSFSSSTAVRKHDSNTSNPTKKQKLDENGENETHPLKDENIHAFCVMIEQEMMKMTENTRENFKDAAMLLLVKKKKETRNLM